MTTRGRARDPEPRIASLEGRQRSAFWSEQQERVVGALDLRPGMRALSVGCGLGAVIELVAEQVTDTGLAVGVDDSASLIEQARSRTLHGDGHLRFEVASAESLPFEDESFDALLSEGALQHVLEAERALAELWRVARPGARIVALEPDWDTFVIDGESLAVTRSFCRRLGQRVGNPVVGRELAGLLLALGAVDVVVETATNVISDHGTAEREFALTELAAAAVRDGSTPAAIAERWLADLGERDTAGRFLAAATYFRVVARKPL